MISIIIPAYNELENIEMFEKELFAECDKLDKEYEVIVVNDGSTDDTYEALDDLKLKHPHLRVFKNKTNRGMGYSMRRGIDKARGDSIVFLDCDLTFHPRDISKLIARFNKGDVDFVIGAYVAEDVDPFRLFLSKAVNYIYSLVLGSTR